MRTIVFTGGSSLLAQSWIKYDGFDSNYILALHNKKLENNKLKTLMLNYDSVDHITEKLKEVKADVVVNCIGLTSVEACEADSELAFQINQDIAVNIAMACLKSDIKLVHISTDHLFDGTNSFKQENEKLSPLNNYAKTKGEGEKAVLVKNPTALVIRTNFFGWGPTYKASFSDKIS